jgi:futalosine hydrolase
MLALLCSVRNEANLLLSQAASVRTRTAGSKPVMEGTIEGQRVVLCTAGMGKVNAAHAATLLLTDYCPEALIVFGIGGAYVQSGAQIGELALANEEVAGDEGVLTPEGFRDTEYIGIPLIRSGSSVFYNFFSAPGYLVEDVYQSLLLFQKSGGARTHLGRFVTLSTCTGTAARARELEERHHGVCENMEGAAAAQVASLHNVPWLELRGISNLVGDRDLGLWDIQGAAETAQRAVIHLLKNWRR